MTSRKTNQGRKLSFQQLENRQLMAGNVTAVVQNHSLIITGDNADNDFEITQTAAGSYKITPGAYTNTTINGKTTPQTFSGITGDFNIKLQGGFDVVDVDRLNSSSTLTLPRSLNVDLGNGGGEFSLENAKVLGGFSAKSGNGDQNTVDIQNTTIGSKTVNGGKNDCVIDLGNGINADADLSEVTVERDLSIKGNGTSGEYIYLYATTAGRNLNVQTSDGDDTVWADLVNVGGQLKVQTGKGNDFVALGEEMQGPLGAETPYRQYGVSADSVFVDLGKGDDTLRVYDVLAKQSTYSGNDGTDHIFHDGPTTGSLSESGFELYSFALPSTGWQVANI